MSEKIQLKEDCPFCELGQFDVGYKNNRGSRIVYKTGNDVTIDWFVVLQPTTASDPKTGMNFQIMPVGHIEHLTEMATREICSNYGLVTGITSKAMEKILKEDHNLTSGSKYEHNQIYVCKTGTPENSIPHLHFKTLPFSGPAAQPFPTDAGWMKKEPIQIRGIELVCASKVDKARIDKERYDNLFERSLQYFNDISKQYK